MKTKILPVMENLFILFVVIASVWGICLFWADNEFAEFLVRQIYHMHGGILSSGGVTWWHMIFLPIPSLVISALFGEELVYRFMGWRRKNR